MLCLRACMSFPFFYLYTGLDVNIYSTDDDFRWKCTNTVTSVEDNTVNIDE